MEKINLVELLKDCPKGMELDCTIYDNATLEIVFEGCLYPIQIQTPEGLMSLSKYGSLSSSTHSKCVIFPKGKTTWEGFVPPCKFKDGDIIYIKDKYNQEWCSILSNDVDNKLYTYIDFYINYSILYYNKPNILCEHKYITEYRLTTEEEKQKLFDAIKANGYKWNEETNTLEKLSKSYEEETTNKAIFDGNAQCCDIMNDIIKEETMEEIIKIDIPKGYEFARVDDDNQQVVFEKIGYQYPKTYEECCGIIDYYLDETTIIGYEKSLLENFQKLLICRNAYWKIAGAQMGLGKLWEPDWLNTAQDKFVLYTHDNLICLNCFVLGHNVLAFPTKEMRDAFYENFKDLIEQCKELL